MEIEAAISSFPPHKAPGSDGFSIEFYRSYMEQLPPRLSTLFTYCLEHQTLSPSMMEAYMILVTKPGKEPTEYSSYRPNALLNADLKILTKILATRLARIIPSLIDIDHTGFMPGTPSTSVFWPAHKSSSVN